MEAVSRGLALVVDETDYLVQSDPRLLERVLRNLLANAIRYTDSGQVRLVTFREARGVRIEVQDTGMGIPAHQLHAIFDDYYRTGSSVAAPITGTGLGLAIVKCFTASLNDGLDVRSKPGEGTCFALIVPEARPDAG